MKQVKLLCTGSFKATKLLPAHIVLDIKPFIETSILDKEVDIRKALEDNDVLIFTSANAVKAVEIFFDKSLNKKYKIYCIESNTSQKVAEVFGADSIKGSAAYGAELAEIIIEKETAKNIFFFCGNLRREVLPEKLTAAGKALGTLVVYETKDKDQEISLEYDGYLFFSPSAVDAFFEQYPNTKDTKFFAIGTTTAQALEKYVDTNNIIISARPEKELLLQTAIEYFNL